MNDLLEEVLLCMQANDPNRWKNLVYAAIHSASEFAGVPLVPLGGLKVGEGFALDVGFESSEIDLQLRGELRCEMGSSDDSGTIDCAELSLVLFPYLFGKRVTTQDSSTKFLECFFNSRLGQWKNFDWTDDERDEYRAFDSAGGWAQYEQG